MKATSVFWRPRLILMAIALLAALYAVVQHYNEVERTTREMSLFGRILKAFEESNTGLISAQASSNNIADANRAACEMFGYKDGELAGKDVGLILPEPFREIHRAKIMVTSEMAIKGKPHVATMRCIGVKKDGSPVDVFVRVFVTKSGAVAIVSLSREIRHTTMGVAAPIAIPAPVYPLPPKAP